MLRALRTTSALLLLAAPPGAARADEPCPPRPPPCGGSLPPPTAPRPREGTRPPGPPSPAPGPAPVVPAATPAPGAPPQRSDLAPEEMAAARARGAEVRAALPAPAGSWSWTRELVFDGFSLGATTVSAEPALLAEKPVWLVTESTERRAGEGRVRSETVLYLAPDLSLIRGESVLRAPAGTEAFSFGRRDGRMEVTAEADGKTQTVEVDAPDDATMGLFATLRFAQASLAHTQAGRPCLLTGFDPRHAFGDDAGKPLPAGQADVQVERARPPRPPLGSPPGAPEPLLLSTPAGRASTLTLTRDGQAFEVWGHFPHWHLRLPSAGGWTFPPDWFARIGDAPQSAYQALCTFGRGYHLAKPELLDMAFHWPSMHAHEIASKTIEADVPLERMKAAYIQEFLDRSKHRTAADCDDLLTQILVTSAITTAADGTVSIQALPVYGGHTFHCAARDGRWWIVRVD